MDAGAGFLDIHAGDAQAPASGGRVEYPSQLRVDLVAGDEVCSRFRPPTTLRRVALVVIHGANVVGDFVVADGVGDLK